MEANVNMKPKSRIRLHDRIISLIMAFSIIISTFAVAGPIQFKAKAAAEASNKGVINFDKADVNYDSKLKDNGDGTYTLRLDLWADVKDNNQNQANDVAESGYFKAKVTGEYLVELWGADGGTGESTKYNDGGHGGTGGHVYGIVNLNKGDILYYTLGGYGNTTLVQEEGGGANGPGGTHGNHGSYSVGAGGGYSAVYLFKAGADATYFENTYAGNKNATLSEADRMKYHIMVAGGGGGGGAGDGYILGYKPIQRADGGNGGSISSANDNAKETTVPGRVFFADDGLSSGKLEKYAGNGGTTEPGGITKTWLSFRKGDTPNDWYKQVDSESAGGHGSSGDYRGGGGGAGYTGGSGGIMASALTPGNIGGGGGGSSFVAEGINYSTNIPASIQNKTNPLGSTNKNGGFVNITFVDADNNIGTGSNLGWLDELDFSANIAKYFDVKSITSTSGSATSAAQKISLKKAKLSTNEKVTLSITLSPKEGFAGGNNVNIFADETAFAITAKDPKDNQTFGIGETVSYVNVPLNFKAEAVLTPESILLGEDLAKATDFYNDKYVAARAGTDANQYFYDFIDNISEYYILDENGESVVFEDGKVSPSSTTAYIVGFTVTPNTTKYAAVGNRVKTTDFTAVRPIEVLSEIVLNDVTYSVSKKLTYADGKYKLTLFLASAARKDPATGKPVNDPFLKYTQSAPLDISSVNAVINSEENPKFTSAGEKTFTAPYSGYYLIQAWGANGGKGGDADARANLSGYGYGGDGGIGATNIKGYIYLNKNDIVTVSIGANGTDGEKNYKTTSTTSDGALGSNGTGGSKTTILVNSVGYVVAGAGGGGGGAASAEASTSVNNGPRRVNKDGGAGSSSTDFLDSYDLAFSTDSSDGTVGDYVVTGTNWRGTVGGAGGTAGYSYNGLSTDTSALSNEARELYNSTIANSSNPSSTSGAVRITFIEEDRITSSDTDEINAIKANLASRVTDISVLNYEFSKYFADVQFTSASYNANNVSYSTTYESDGKTIKDITASIDNLVWTWTFKPADGFLGGNYVPVLASKVWGYDGATLQTGIVMTQPEDRDGANDGDGVADVRENKVADFANVELKNPLTVTGTDKTVTYGTHVNEADVFTVNGTYPDGADAWKADFVTKSVDTNFPTGGYDATENKSFEYAITVAPKTEKSKASVVALQTAKTVTATATVNVECTVSTNLTRVTYDGPKKVALGESLKARLKAVQGYIIDADSVSVTVNGVAVPSAYNAATGEISIGEVNGNVVITATASAQKYELHIDAYDENYNPIYSAEYLKDNNEAIEAGVSIADKFTFAENAVKSLPAKPGYEFHWDWQIADNEKDCETNKIMPGHNTWITGTYEPLFYKIKIDYVDMDGKTLADSYEDDVWFTLTDTVTSPTISGYVLDDPSQASIKFTVDEDFVNAVDADGVYHVTVKYRVAANTLTIRHIKTDSNATVVQYIENITVGTNFNYTLGSTDVPIPAGYETGYTPDKTAVSGTMVSGGMTVDILYKPDEYQVNFNTNGVTLEEPVASIKVVYNDVIGAYEELPVLENQKDKAFLGWFTEAKGGTQITNSTPVNDVTFTDGKVTLFAHWSEAPTFKVDSDPAGWTNGSVTVTLTRTDDGKAKDPITYFVSTDGETWTELSGNTYTIDDTKEYTFKAVSADGGVYTAEPYTAKIDKVDPTVTLSITTSPVKERINELTFGLFFNNTVDVDISCADDASGIAKVEYCVTDKVFETNEALEADATLNWKSGNTTGDTTVSVNPDKKAIVYARVTDAAGNVSYAASYGFITDKTMPKIQDVNEVNGKWYDSSTIENVIIKVTDTLAGIENNQVTYTVGATTNTVTPDENGYIYIPVTAFTENQENTITVSAKDNSQNTATANYTVGIDNNAPTVAITVAGKTYEDTNPADDTLYFNADQSVSISYTDNESGFGVKQYYISSTPITDLATVAWETYPAEGLNLEADGTYYVYAKAVDGVGHEVYAATQKIIVDKTNPGVGVANPDNNKWISTDSAIVVTATDNLSGVASVTYKITEGTNAGATGTLKADPTDNTKYTYTVNTDGDYKIVFTVTDLADNSITSEEYIVKREALNPTIEVSAPAGGDAVQSQTATVTADAASGIADLWYRNAADPDEPQYWHQIDKNNPTVEITENGTYIFRALSNSGLEATTTQTYDNIDNAAPVLDVTAVTIGTDANQTETAYTFGDWTNESVKVTVANKTANLGTTNYYYAQDENGNGVIDDAEWKSLPENPFTLETEGEYTYYFKAESAAGVPSEVVTKTIKIDKTAPGGQVTLQNTVVSTILNALDPLNLFYNDTVSVKIDSWDNGTVKSEGVKAYYLYSHKSMTEAELANTGTAWNEYGDTFAVVDANKYIVYVMLEDAAGNRTYLSSESFQIDKTAPVIVTNYENDTGSWNTDSTIDLKFKVTDEIGGSGVNTDTIKVEKIENGVVTAIDGVTVTDGIYKIPNSALTNGIYDIKISAADKAGNTQECVINIKREAQLEITENPQNITVLYGSDNAEFSVTAIADSGIDSVEWFVKLPGETEFTAVSGGIQNGDTYTISIANPTVVAHNGLQVKAEIHSKAGNTTDTNTATLTVEKRLIVVSPDEQSVRFGEDDADLTYTIKTPTETTGIVNGDDVTFTGGFKRVEGREVGHYKITNDNFALADDKTAANVNGNYYIEVNPTEADYEITTYDPGAEVKAILVGAQGTDGWFIKDTDGKGVKITAPDGYLISFERTEDPDKWSDYLTVADGKYDGVKYYLRNKADGAISIAKNTKDISFFKQDTVTPVVTATVDNKTISTTRTIENIVVTKVGLSGVSTVTITDPSGNVTDITDTYSAGVVVSQKGTYTITVTNGAGVSGTTEVVVADIDTKAPELVVNATTSDNKQYTSGVWSNKDITVVLSNGNTEQLGTTTYYYVVDGEYVRINDADGNATNTFALTTDGVKTVTVVAKSQSGIYSEEKTLTLKVDKTAPFADIKIDDVKETILDTLLSTITFGKYKPANVSVVIEVTDDASISGLASVEYLTRDEANVIKDADTLKGLPDTAWKNGTSFSYTAAKDGDTLVVYAKITDNAGNVTYISSDGHIFDTTAPTAVRVDENEWINGKAPTDKVEFKVSDSVSGVGTVKYQIADGTEKTATITDGKFEIPAAEFTKDGDITVTVNMTDGVGNEATQTFTVKVDQKTPAITVSVDDTKPSQTKDIKGTVEIPESGIKTVELQKYNEETNTWEKVADVTLDENGNFTNTVSDNGTYKVVVTTGSDKTAESEEITVSRIDRAEPAIVVVATKADGSAYESGDWSNKPVTVKVQMADTAENLGVTTFEYSLNNKDWNSFGSSEANTEALTYDNVKGRNIYFKATSESGITYFTEKFVVNVDTAKPMGEITIANDSWTTLATALGLDKYFNLKQTVTIDSNDNVIDGVAGSGIADVKYYVDKSDTKVLALKSDLDAISADQWKDYTSDKFTIDPNGTYVVYAKITDKVGNVTYISSEGVVIDDKAPVISDVTYTHNGEWTNEKVDITGKVEENLAGLKSVSYEITNADGLVVKPITDIAENGGTFTVPAADLPDGVYTVTFRAVDKADNEAEAKTVYVQKDTTVPSITVTDPSTTWSQGETATITVTDDGCSPITVSCTAEDGTPFTLTDNGDGTYTAIIPANGTYTFKVADDAGNESVVTKTYGKIDAVKPVLSVTAVAGTEEYDYTTAPWTNKDVKFTFANTADSSSSITYKYAALNADGTVGEYENIDGDTLTLTADGEYAYSVIVVNEVSIDGVLVQSEPVVIGAKIDKTLPTGKITVSEDNFWTNLVDAIDFLDLFYKAPHEVKIEAEDKAGTVNSGVDSKYYAVAHSPLGAEDLNGITWTELKNDSVLLDLEGKYIIYAKVVDNAGNVKYLSSDGFILDSTAPVIDVKNDESFDGTWTADETFTIEVSVTDPLTNGANSGIQSVQYTYASADVAPGTEPVYSTEDVTATALADGKFVIPNDNIKQGDYLITITAVDNAGNTATRVIDIKRNSDGILVTAKPQSVTATYGDETAALDAQISSVSEVTYKWQVKVDGEWTDVVPTAENGIVISDNGAASGNITTTLTINNPTVVRDNGTEYRIVVESAIADLSYTVESDAATVTVNKRVITATANGVEALYGEAEKEIPYTVSGILAGDEDKVQLIGAFGRKAGTAVGEYTITSGDLSLDPAVEINGNYELEIAPSSAIYKINEYNPGADVVATIEGVTVDGYDWFVADENGVGAKIIAPLGYKISTSNSVDESNVWADFITVDDGEYTNGVTYYLRNVDDTEGNTSYLAITEEKTTDSFKQDTYAPSISASVDNSTIAQKRTITDITATAGESKAIKVEVRKGDTGEWTDITGTYKSGYTVDENGTYNFRVTNGAGITAETSVEVSKLDNQKPSLEITTDYTSDTWTNESVEISVGNTAENAGETKYYYSTDGGNTWTEITDGKLVISDESTSPDGTTYTIKAVSESGVESAKQSIVVKIDKTAPTNGEVKVDTNTWNKLLEAITFGIYKADTVTVTITADGNVSGIKSIEYIKTADKVTSESVLKNRTDWQPYTDEFTIPAKDAEKFVIYAKVVDNAGNAIYLSSDGHVFDTTAPIVERTDAAKGGWINDKNANVTIKVSDKLSGLDTSTVQYKIGDGEFVSATVAEDGTFDIPATAFGNGQNINLTVTAKDKLGHTVTEVIPVSVDTASPVVNVTVDTDNPGQSQNIVTTVSPAPISGVDKVEIFEQDENGNWIKVAEVTPDENGDYDFKVTDNGTYKVVVTSGSGLETEEGPIVINNIDTAKPVIEVVATPDGYKSGDWANETVTLNIRNKTDNQGTTKFEYSTDGENWNALSNLTDKPNEAGTLSYNNVKGQEIYFRAESAAGVKSEVVKFVVNTDSTAPDGDILITGSTIKTILNTITYDKFFKETQTVKISYDDGANGYGNVTVQYYLDKTGNTNVLTKSELDALGAEKWTSGTSLSVNPNSDYVVYAKLTDGLGNYQYICSQGLVVDDTAPVIEATYNYNNKWTVDANAAITGNITDNLAGLESATYVLVGSDGLQIGGVNALTVNADGTYTIDNLPNGIYSVTIHAVDKAGNTENAPTVINVKKDDIKPTITSVTEQAADADWTDKFDAEVTVGPIGVSGISAVQYRLEGSGTWISIEPDADGKYVAPITEKGTYEFRVVNGAGNVSDITKVTYDNVDSVKPVLSVIAESKSAEYDFSAAPWTNGDVVFTFSNDVHNDSTVKYQSAPVAADGTIGTYADLAGNTLTVSSDGQFAYSIIAVNEAGVKSDSVIIKASVDKQAPAPDGQVKVGDTLWSKVINAIDPLDLFFKEAQTVTVDSATLVDDTSKTDKVSGVYKTYYVLSKTSLDETTLKALESGWTEYKVPFIVDAEDEQIVYIKVVDNAGNEKYFSTVGFIIDKTAPTIDVDYGTNTSWNTDSEINIGVTVTDTGSGIKAVQYKYPDKDASGNAKKDADGNIVYLTADATLDSDGKFTIPNGNIPNGEYTITIIATDKSNNEQTRVINVKRDSAGITILAQPQDVTVTYGDAGAVFSTSVMSTSGLKYTWQRYDTQTGDWVDVTSVLNQSADGLNTTATLTVKNPSVANDNGAQYRLYAYNTAGYEMTSNTVTLTVNPKDLHVTIDNKTAQYGETPDKELTYSFDTNDVVGTDSITFTGGLQREDGTAVGKYIISTTDDFAVNDVNYKAVVDPATAIYEITPYAADGVEATLDGTKGTNDWYVADKNGVGAKIVAPDGYLISKTNTLDGSWTETITVDDGDYTTDGVTYYLRQITDDSATDGAISVAKVIKFKQDTTKPEATLIVENNKFKTFLNDITFGLFFNKTVDVSVENYDATSGIAKVEYAIQTVTSLDDDGIALENIATASLTWNDGNSGSVDPSEMFIAYARVTDNAGNVTYLKSDVIVVDDEAPVITTNDSGKWVTTDDATVTINVTDNLAGIKDGTLKYSIDGKAYVVIPNDSVAANGDVQIPLGSDLGEGEHNIKVTATDRASNTLSPEFTMTVNKDTSDPTATVTPDTTNPADKVTLTVTPENVGVSGVDEVVIEKQNPDGTWTQVAVVTPDPDDGSYKVDVDDNGEYRAVVTTGAGKEVVSEPITVENIDKVAPVLTVTAKVGDAAYDGSWTNKPITITVTNNSSNLNPKDTVYEYSVDGVNWTEITDVATDGKSATLTINGDTDISDTYRFRATSAAGIQSDVTKTDTVSVKYDNTAPTGEIKVDTESWQKFLETVTFGIYKAKDVTVTITADGNKSGIKSIEYIKALDGDTLSQDDLASASWGEYSKFTVPATDEGKFVIYAKITDNAGNVTYISTNGYVFDTTAPVITVNDNPVSSGTKDEGSGARKIVITDDNLKEVVVTKNGVPVTDIVTVSEDGKTVTINIPKDSEGEYVVTATDEAGNEVTYTLEATSIANDRDDYKDAIDDAAEKAKDAIDAMDYLTEDEKQDAKDEIDRIAEQTKKDIEDADSVDDIKDIIEKAEDDILDKVQEEAIADIEKAADEAKKAIDEMDDLTPDEKEAAKKEIDDVAKDAIDDIKEAETSDGIKSIVDTAEEDILDDLKKDAVKDIENAAEEAKKAIDDAAKDAKDAIDNMEDLSDEEKDAAKQKIDDDATAAKNEVDEDAQKAIDKINDPETDTVEEIVDAVNDGELEIDKDRAKAEIDIAADEAKAAIDAMDDLSDDDKDKAKQKIDDDATAAKETIDAATTHDDVDKAVKDGKEEILEDLKKTAEDDIKKAADKAIDEIKDQNLTPEQESKLIEEIEKTRDKAISDLDTATTPDGVAEIVKDATDSFDDTVDDAIAQKFVNDYASGSDNDPYDKKDDAVTKDNAPQIISGEEPYNKLTPEQQAKVDEIIKSATDAEKASDDSYPTYDSYKDMLDDAKKALDDAKNDAKDDLKNAADEAIDKIKDTDGLTDEEKQKLIDEINDELEKAEDAIDNATTPDEIDDIVNDAKDTFDDKVDDGVAQAFVNKYASGDDNDPYDKTEDKVDKTNATQIMSGEEPYNELTPEQQDKVNEIIGKPNGSEDTYKSDDPGAEGGKSAFEKMLDDAKKVVDDEKTSAKDDIDKAADDAKKAIDEMDNLSEEEKQEAKDKIDSDADAAKEAIDKATTVEDVDKAVDDGEKAILDDLKDAAKDELEKAAEEAKDAIDKMDGLTDDEKQALRDEIDDELAKAIADVDKAATVDEVKKAVADGEAEFDDTVDDATARDFVNKYASGDDNDPYDKTEDKLGVDSAAQVASGEDAYDKLTPEQKAKVNEIISTPNGDEETYSSYEEMLADAKTICSVVENDIIVEIKAEGLAILENENATSEADIKRILAKSITEEDLALVLDGGRIEIIMTIQEIPENEVNSKAIAADGNILVKHVEITIVKNVYNASDVRVVHENITKTAEEINFVISVGDAEKAGRVFYIYADHGRLVAEKMSDGDGIRVTATVLFGTDEFSVFSIAYAPEKTANKPSKKPDKVVNTNDDNNFAEVGITLALSASMFVIVKRKKDEEEAETN